jgi:hypothetical protein
MHKPENKHCHYKAGFKYQTALDYVMETGVKPEFDIETAYISLYKDGTLIIKQGYCWDGPSGPTIDTKNFMRGSLEHDAFYQLMREKHLPRSYRIKADERLYNVCREDGMSYIRAQWVYRGVRVGGGSSTNPKNKKKMIVAP